MPTAPYPTTIPHFVVLTIALAKCGTAMPSDLACHGHSRDRKTCGGLAPHCPDNHAGGADTLDVHHKDS